MNKTVLLLILVLGLFAGCASVQNQSQVENSQQVVDVTNHEKIVLEPTDENFLLIFRGNPDGREYYDKYQDIRVTNVTKFHPSDINISQEDFKELYLNLTDKEYYKVDFASPSAPLSMMTVIDLEEREVVKIFGLLIMGMG